MNKENLPKLDGLLPKQEKEVFSSPGECIYCGEKNELTDEHIIPFALGGNLVLEKSSCKKCAKITSKFELTCLRTMYGPVRLLYSLPTRRPNKRPKALPLKVKHKASDENWSYLAVEQNKFPFLITFPYFEAPNIVANEPITNALGAVSKRFWIRGASPHYNFKELLQLLVTELGVYSIMPESIADVKAFCMLISKIAHSYAVAKIGLSKFTPFLNPIIIENKLDHCRHYVGSIERDETPINKLHELNILKFNNIDVVFIRVRLLCKLGTPSYIVAVGKPKH